MKNFLKQELVREDARSLLGVLWALLALALTLYSLQAPNLINFGIAGALALASATQFLLAYRSYKIQLKAKN